MNLFLHGVEDFEIANDDTLRHPTFLEAGKLRTFDMVLANPPYSIKQWDRESFASDPYGRNFLGTPPQGRADYAFIQHILKSMDPKSGRCAILLPHGVLFRNEESEMREKLVRSDLVEAVIGLGANLFFNSPMEACILICRSEKAPNRRKEILFVDASAEVTRKNAQSYLEPRHIQRIVEAYRSDEDIEGFSSHASFSKIEDNAFSLSIPLYVKPFDDENTDDRSIEETIGSWRTASTGPRPCSMILLRNCMKTMVSNMTRVCLGDVAREIKQKVPVDQELPTVGLEHLDPGEVELAHWDEGVETTFTKAFSKGQVLFGRRRLPA